MAGNARVRSREWARPTGPRQSRAMSLVEAIANVAIGYGVAVMSFVSQEG